MIISENFVSPAFLRNTKSNFFAFDEFNSFPFSNVIGFALPATINPKVALTLPAANEHRILFFSKSSST